MSTAPVALASNMAHILDRATTPAVLTQLAVVNRTRLTGTVAVAVAELPGAYTFERMADAVQIAMSEGKRAGGGRVVVQEL